MFDVYFRFAKSARRHRIAKGRARAAMANAVLIAIDTREDGRSTGIFVGVDNRGLLLEIGIGGLDTDEPIWSVVHVMPYRFSKHEKRE